MTALDEWLLMPQRVAIHVPTATAVAADLHLGYSLARRRAGDAVPDVSLEDELLPLATACALAGARRLAIAGDLLEDGGCSELFSHFVAWVKRRDLELAGIVPGNHDLRGALSPDTADDRGFASVIRLGEWAVVHGDQPLPEGRVVHGHEHPVLRLPRHQAAPCFLVQADRLVLPAYSADAAGVNVLHARRWRGYRCLAIAGQRILDLGPLATLRQQLG